MNLKSIFNVFVLLVALGTSSVSNAEQPFSDLVGNVSVGEVSNRGAIQIPYLTWGGDMPMFYGNGDLKTKAGSIFAQKGLNLNLVNGDDFVQQVRDCKSGKSPFLRGTFTLIAASAETMGSDPRTKLVPLFQMTWSAGDHCVTTSNVKTSSDLKGATVILQKSGPHIGMLNDILKTAGISWDDINVIWTKDLTGTNESPKNIFEREVKKGGDKKIACFVITPDMIGLTGGLDSVGTGVETVKGAKVTVSTAELSYSVFDGVFCRKDFYDNNTAMVEKLVAGYLKAVEEVIDLKKAYESSGSAKYLELCEFSNTTFKFDCPAESEDGSLGLIMDCTFVGHPGNVAFFTDKNNPHGFDVFHEKSLDLVVSRGYAKSRQGIFTCPIRWSADSVIGSLTKTSAVKGPKFKVEAVIREVEALVAGATENDLIEPFTIPFAINESEFDSRPFTAEFEKVCEVLGMYGNAVIAIRGHVDPYLVLGNFCAAGMLKGELSRTGSKGNYKYRLKNGTDINLASTQEIADLINSGAFDGHSKYRPREIMTKALGVSKTRAQAVRLAIIKFAEAKGMVIDESQIQAVGVGIREPIIPRPMNDSDQAVNVRVEFRMIKVAAESRASDFDFDF